MAKAGYRSVREGRERLETGGKNAFHTQNREYKSESSRSRKRGRERPKEWRIEKERTESAHES